MEETSIFVSAIEYTIHNIVLCTALRKHMIFNNNYDVLMILNPGSGIFDGKGKRRLTNISTEVI